ncbi:MAG: dTDP-4-dehydrorhamnose 3,5-epimerase [Ponticaulis sp.]|nr:dTDP-4-dehydrorhamnose 3,5-epimerase [Ponticaulis sp.]
MDITRLDLPGLMLVTPEARDSELATEACLFDEREFLRKSGVDFRIVETRRVTTHRSDTIRGLRTQVPPAAQSMLVRIERGRVLKCVVDIRKGSPTYLSSFLIELVDEDDSQLFIPKGFLHGLRALEPECRLVYALDAHDSPEHKRFIRYDDVELDCDWGLTGHEMLHLAEEDQDAGAFQSMEHGFVYSAGRL